ncbi:MAG: alpha/beta hydrolase [Patescibacteria group bacterium]
MKEQALEIQGIRVSYKIAGEGPAVFILHGWGRGSDSWAEVQEALSRKGYLVVAPDLPGFGRTRVPQSAWGIAEYADFVLQFANKLGVDKFVLLGHSFGGQVAVRFAASYPEKIEKLILCAPAAIRREPGPKEVCVKYIAKAGTLVLTFIPSEGLRQLLRKVFASILGRSDYLQAPGIMRKVMEKVIREDLSAIFVNITANTLLVWGEKDRPVPLEDAYFMEKRLPHSVLRVIPGVGHRVHREVPEKLTEFIVQFLQAP